MMNRAPRKYLLLPIALAVCTTFSLGQSSPTTRVEQSDPSVTYSGDWYSNPSSSHSGGTSVLTNSKGAQAAITFTGTGITWLGLTGTYSGIAWVYIDGTLNTVDTYTSIERYQQVLYSVRGLNPGSHTLTIEVPHIRDGSTSGSWVWIDAFDIENGSSLPGGITAALGRTEQNNPALNYTGTWYANTISQNSGGSAVLAVDAGSRASINFTGTGIAWNAYRDEYSGIAKVYLDGVLQPLVDTYLSPAQAQSPAYAINGLSAGTHSLTVEVTGTHNDRAGGAWIWVDSFDVPGNGAGSVIGSGLPLPNGGPPPPRPGGVIRMEQNNSAITFLGSWFINGGTRTSGGTALLAMDAGAKAMVTFTGTGIQWIGVRDEWSGLAKVSVDGVFQQNADAYMTPGLEQQVIYKISGLPPGTHTLSVEATGTANPSSRGAWIWIDAFDVTP